MTVAAAMAANVLSQLHLRPFASKELNGLSNPVTAGLADFLGLDICHDLDHRPIAAYFRSRIWLTTAIMDLGASVSTTTVPSHPRLLQERVRAKTISRSYYNQVVDVFSRHIRRSSVLDFTDHDFPYSLTS